VDRLGRRLHDLVGFLSELRALKIDPFLRQQGTRHPDAVGKAMFQVIGVVGEFACRCGGHRNDARELKGALSKQFADKEDCERHEASAVESERDPDGSIDL